MTIDIINTELTTMAGKAAPDEERIKRQAASFVALADGFQVEDQSSYDMAASELRALKAKWTEVEEQRVSFTGPLNKVLDMLNARFQPALRALKAAETTLKSKMGAYLTLQEQRATEARRKAEADAKAERDRQAAIAAEQRLVAEKAEAEAAAARGKKAKAEAEARAEEARRAAAAAETTAAVVIAQPVAVAVSKGRGISTPKTWDFEVENKLALAEHIVKFRPDLIVLLEVDAVKMRMHVKMQGEATMLPGVRVFEKTSISVR